MNKGKEKGGAFGILLRFADGKKRYFLVSILASAVAILFNFLMPQVVGFTVDSVIGDKAATLPGLIAGLFERVGGVPFLRSNIIFCALGVVICACVAGLFNYLARVNNARGTERLIESLRNALFEHTQYLPFEWYSQNQTGDIIQRCTSDVETTKRFVSLQLLEVLRTVILVLAAFIIMFTVNAWMALVVLAFVPVILAYTTYFFKGISSKFLKCDEAEGELMVRVQENLTGVRVVRAFGRERHELEKFDEKNIEYTNKWVALGYTLGFYWGAGDVVSASQLLAVIVFGSFLTAGGRLSLGELLIFISYTQMIVWPIRQLGRILSEMSKTGVALKRIKEILDAETEDEEPNAKKPPLERDIAFKNVSFTYEAQPVLRDISFTVKNGSTFGILGATGSGKSTITYLLNRLYELPEDGGKITVGGVDIREIDKKHLRRNVGLVLQEPFLFSKTIFENIDIASRTSDMKRVRKTADIAAVDENIMSFSGGYETLVGERGVTLSGGQKQRIAIARTLMTGAPIMIFDDSMSSLDMETDAKIREALRENTGDATVILISHRISTLMNADTIMVLEDGKIAEMGSHSELLEKGGAYKRVYDIQSGSEKERGESSGG